MDIKVGSKYKVNDRKYFKNKHPKNFFNTEHIITCTEINEGFVCFVSEDGDEGLTYLDNEVISRLDLVGELKMKTGAELKARRLELGITQHDLAGNTGISRTQLSRMESGKIEIPIEIRPVLYDSLYTKHEQPKLKFSDLEVGDYVYVRDDLVDFFKYGTCYFLERGMDKGLQRIDDIEGNIITLQNKRNYPYSIEMIDLSRSMKKEDYLKMNEKENFIFDRLIDVARKGFKDGVVSYYGQSVSAVSIEANGEKRRFNSHFIKDGIEFVQSLYTEEFIIEKMSDELRIKSGANVTLSNGVKCVYFDDGERKLRHDGDYYPCNFLVLKCATVKQSK